MKFEIVNVPSTKLIGMEHRCNFVKYDVQNLWRSFMPRKSEIQNTDQSIIYSVTFYPENFYSNFNPHSEFTKVAALKIFKEAIIPQGMHAFEIPEGLYFKFRYIGAAENYPKLFESIIKEILPSNNLKLDNRPFFEVLGPEYKNNEPDSEEDIYIPVSNYNSQLK